MTGVAITRFFQFSNLGYIRVSAILYVSIPAIELLKTFFGALNKNQLTFVFCFDDILVIMFPSCGKIHHYKIFYNTYSPD